MIPRLFRFLIYLFLCFVIYYFGGGFSSNPSRVIEAVIFVMVFSIFLYLKHIRIYSFLGIVFTFILMVIFYVIKDLQLATLFGDIGFGSLILIILIYVPNLIKNGYLEDVKIKLNIHQ